VTSRSFWETFFVLRGSLVQKITPLIGVIAGLSLVVAALQRAGVTHLSAITPHALLLDAMSRTVEITILESLGETDLPESLKPVSCALT